MTVAGKRGRPATRAEALLGSEPSLCRTLEGAKQHSPWGCNNDDDTRLLGPRRRHDGCWFARRWGGRLTSNRRSGWGELGRDPCGGNR